MSISVTASREKEMFVKHAANLRAVEQGKTQAERLHKSAIARNDEPAIGFTSRTHLFMVGVVAESRLRKICTDPDGFNTRERDYISRAGSQQGKWSTTVDSAFRRQYAVPFHEEVDDLRRNSEVRSRWNNINTLLETHLKGVVSDRNDVAHGEWTWLLNNKETASTGTAPPLLNYLQIYRRDVIIECLANIVHALVVSEATFNRDFDRYYGLLQAQQTMLDGSDYQEFAALQRRRRAGRGAPRRT